MNAISSTHEESKWDKSRELILKHFSKNPFIFVILSMKLI